MRNTDFLTIIRLYSKTLESFSAFGVVSKLSASIPGSEGQYWPPGPNLEGQIKTLLCMASGYQTTACATAKHVWGTQEQCPLETACHTQEGSQSKLLLNTSHGQELLELSPTSTPEHQIWYLNIKQVQLHGVSRVHILVRVKELPSQQQRFVFIYSLLSECSAVVQPIYCNTVRQMKELCLLFHFVEGDLNQQ